MYFSTDSLHAMSTNWAPLLADLFLYSSEAYFIQQPLKKKENKLSRSFKCTYRNIEDVLSLNNSRFGDCVYRIYPIELEIKDTTDTNWSASYLDLHIEIDSEGRFLRTKLYDKKEIISIFPLWTFHLHVATFQQHLHMEYISQFIRYSRACGSYQDFLDWGLPLTMKQMN